MPLKVHPLPPLFHCLPRNLAACTIAPLWLVPDDYCNGRSGFIAGSEQRFRLHDTRTPGLVREPMIDLLLDRHGRPAHEDFDAHRVPQRRMCIKLWLRILPQDERGAELMRTSAFPALTSRRPPGRGGGTRRRPGLFCSPPRAAGGAFSAFRRAVPMRMSVGIIVT